MMLLAHLSAICPILKWLKILVVSPGSMFLSSCTRNRPVASFIHDSVRTVYGRIALRLSQFSERLHAV